MKLLMTLVLLNFSPMVSLAGNVSGKTENLDQIARLGGSFALGREITIPAPPDKSNIVRGAYTFYIGKSVEESQRISDSFKQGLSEARKLGISDYMDYTSNFQFQNPQCTLQSESLNYQALTLSEGVTITVEAQKPRQSASVYSQRLPIYIMRAKAKSRDGAITRDLIFSCDSHVSPQALEDHLKTHLASRGSFDVATSIRPAAERAAQAQRANGVD